MPIAERWNQKSSKGDLSRRNKVGRVRLSLVNYRLAGVTLVSVLAIPWMATWQEVADRAPIAPASGSQTAQVLGSGVFA